MSRNRNGSRVRRSQKYMNVSGRRHGEVNPSRVRRYKDSPTDYHKATSLTSWLFLKYGLTYTQFRNKSSAARYALRSEYTEDTGRQIYDGGDTTKQQTEDQDPNQVELTIDLRKFFSD